MGEWADIVSVLLQAFIAVIAGCVWPWFRQIKEAMDNHNSAIETLTRRANSHNRRIRRIERERRGEP